MGRLPFLLLRLVLTVATLTHAQETASGSIAGPNWVRMQAPRALRVAMRFEF